MGLFPDVMKIKLKMQGMHLDYCKDTPYIDEGNLVFICRKLSATKMTPDQFIDSSIESSWYADGNLHTMYVGEILEVLAR